jgi:hypothetical protein
MIRENRFVARRVPIGMKRPLRWLALATILVVSILTACTPGGGGGATTAPAASAAPGGSPAPGASAPASAAPGGYTY